MNKSFIIYLIILTLFAVNSCKTQNNLNNNEEKDPRKIEIDENIDKHKLKIHMEKIFNYIESTVAKGNFDVWYESISSNYKNFLNNPVNLKKIMQNSNYLKNRNIELTGPKDYFEYVVIPSREGIPLKFYDCEFISTKHIKVICFDKTDKLIYDFIFEDNLWKIDR